MDMSERLSAYDLPLKWALRVLPGLRVPPLCLGGCCLPEAAHCVPAEVADRMPADEEDRIPAEEHGVDGVVTANNGLMPRAGADALGLACCRGPLPADVGTSASCVSIPPQVEVSARRPTEGKANRKATLGP